MSALVIRTSLVAIAAAVAACATNPVTGQREISLMSEGQEIALGKEADGQIRAEMGLYDDPELQRYVSDIGLRLAKLSERPNLPWQFAVVDQPAINAFALPGGYIYLTRGILAFLDNEAEVAGVLGHEIGHVTARHAAQQYTRQVGGQVGLVALGIFVPAARPFGELSAQALGLLFLKYGREDELQADTLGARYSSSASWDPAGVTGMLSTLGRLDEASGQRKGIPNFLSTHPDPLQRVEQIQPIVQKLKEGRSGFEVDRESLLQRVDGVMYGDNPDQGIVRDSTFLHPPLRFRVDFPKGWEVANSAQQVVSKAPEADVFLLLQIVRKPDGTDVRDIALGHMQGAGFQAVDGQRTTINGLEAFVGTYRGTIEGLGASTSRAAHIAHGGRVYLLAGLTSSDAFARAEPTFSSSIRTFRPLSTAEAEGIRPNRLDVYVVRAGDTWASLAQRSGGAIKPSTLAIMNHLPTNQAPPPGARIKLVVGG
jgi:predicted Zn-dependent protease